MPFQTSRVERLENEAKSLLDQLTQQQEEYERRRLASSHVSASNELLGRQLLVQQIEEHGERSVSSPDAVSSVPAGESAPRRPRGRSLENQLKKLRHDFDERLNAILRQYSSGVADSQENSVSVRRTSPLSQSVKNERNDAQSTPSRTSGVDDSIMTPRNPRVALNSSHSSVSGEIVLPRDFVKSENELPPNSEGEHLDVAMSDSASSSSGGGLSGSEDSDCAVVIDCLPRRVPNSRARRSASSNESIPSDALPVKRENKRSASSQTPVDLLASATLSRKKQKLSPPASASTPSSTRSTVPSPLCENTRTPSRPTLSAATQPSSSLPDRESLRPPASSSSSSVASAPKRKKKTKRKKKQDIRSPAPSSSFSPSLSSSSSRSAPAPVLAPPAASSSSSFYNKTFGTLIWCCYNLFLLC